jgi:hypothetical protein
MKVLATADYTSDNEDYTTQLLFHQPCYEVNQNTNGCGHISRSKETVMLDKEQAIVFAKAILKNEGIHAID